MAHRSVATMLIAYLSLVVEHIDEVKILEHVVDENEDGEWRVLVTILAHPEDLGHIIGRQGWRADLLRDMLGSVGVAQQEHYLLQIHDKHDSNSPFCQQYCAGRASQAA